MITYRTNNCSSNSRESNTENATYYETDDNINQVSDFNRELKVTMQATDNNSFDCLKLIEEQCSSMNLFLRCSY